MSTVNIDIIDSACWLTNLISLKISRKPQELYAWS